MSSITVQHVNDRVLTVGNPGLSIFSGSSGGAAATYQSKVLGYSPIAYWPLNDAAGTQATELVNGWHGVSSNVTWGATGIGDGETAASFNGSTSYIDLFSAALAAAFDMDEATVMMWVQMDQQQRAAIDGIFDFFDDSNNYFRSYKNANSTDTYMFRNGSGTNVVGSFSGPTYTNWNCFAITASVTADAQCYYVNGAVADTQDSGLAAAADVIAYARVGRYRDNNFPMDGNLAHVALFDSALSAATIADLAAL